MVSYLRQNIHNGNVTIDTGPVDGFGTKVIVTGLINGYFVFYHVSASESKQQISNYLHHFCESALSNTHTHTIWYISGLLQSCEKIWGFLIKRQRKLDFRAFMSQQNFDTKWGLHKATDYYFINTKCEFPKIYGKVKGLIYTQTITSIKFKWDIMFL